MKGGKPGLNVRRKGALVRLEATYAAFKKQEKTRRSRGRSFLLIMNSLVWSVRWQLSNLESIIKEKTHGNYRTSTSYR